MIVIFQRELHFIQYFYNKSYRRVDIASYEYNFQESLKTTASENYPYLKYTNLEAKGCIVFSESFEETSQCNITALKV